MVKNGLFTFFYLHGSGKEGSGIANQFAYVEIHVESAPQISQKFITKRSRWVVVILRSAVLLLSWPLNNKNKLVAHFPQCGQNIGKPIQEKITLFVPLEASVVNFKIQKKCFNQHNDFKTKWFKNLKCWKRNYSLKGEEKAVFEYF